MWTELGAALAQDEKRVQLAAFINVDTCGIDRARNLMLAAAMQANADWLLMIDSDTWVVTSEYASSGFQLLEMIHSGENLDATIIGAPVKRRGGEGLAVYVRKHDKLFAVKITDATALTVVECDAIGAAVMAINLGKLQLDDRFVFTDQEGEDLNFCRKLRDRGDKILVDTRVQTAHIARGTILLSKDP